MVDFKTFLTRWSRSHSDDSMTFDMRKCAWLLMTEKYSKVACFASTSVSKLKIYQMGKGDHDTLTALVAEFDIMDELLLLKDFDPE